MITNDIQDLLGGTLNDERMAEVLHTLSVSPEKRAALRQHLALSAAMERDRAASALTSVEDVAVWSSIAGTALAPISTAATSTTAASGVTSLLVKAAAVLVVGVGGYVLGTQSAFNIFGTPSPDHQIVAQSTPVPSLPPATATPDLSTQSPAGANRSNSVVNNGASIDASQSMRSAKQSIVRASSPSGSEGPEGSTRAVSFSSTPAPEYQPDGVARLDGVFERHLPDGWKISSVASSLPQVPVQHENPVQQPTVANAESPKDPTLSNRSPKQEQNPDVTPASASVLRRDGFELAFSDRFGTLTPTPMGINNPDPKFSNRSLDVSYHFFGGQVGIGARATYGTFSTVTLEVDAQNEAEIVSFVPRLHAREGLLGEFFLNYRLPITDHFAIGTEGSLGQSSTYRKIGGELFLLGFLSDHIGLQAGVAFSGYSYNLGSQRESLMSKYPNAGVTSDASDSYQGSMLEGKYGILWRF